MAREAPAPVPGNGRLTVLEGENRMLRDEIRVSREAAEITAQLVVEQFEKTEAIMTRLEITSHHLNEKNTALEEANERLQQMDKLKSDFLSSVSHELRTPLTSIRGFASLVEREFARSFEPLTGRDAALQKKSARIQENLKIILKESERLTRLINDVLDLAKIESGRTEWRDAPLGVADLVRDAAAAAHGMFEQKPSVTLLVDVETGLPPFIGDADRLQQVLVNLLNNAAKFTDRGTVTMTAFLNTDQRIQVDIRDTGIGFPAEEAESIFDKFQQARQGDTLADRPKGTGLGLAICREIVGRHGGHIWAQSRLGQGSVFSLTLPPTPGEPVPIANAARAAASAGDDGLPQAAASGRWSKVLVVDDDPAVRSYFSQLLQEQGYTVLTAEDGQAALAAAREHRPDLITMDLAMPVMDGRTAISLLRADRALKRIPIMVISAIPGWETAGGDVAMSKPLDEQRFVDNIHLLLSDARNGGVDAQRKVRFLVLHDPASSPTPMPDGFPACCEVDYCLVGELPARIRAGFEGMVAIPANLLGQVDIALLNGVPALEVMIMPVSSSGHEAAGALPAPETLSQGSQP